MMDDVKRALSVTIPEQIMRARSDLRAGAPVLLTDGASRFVFLAAEALAPARLEAIRSLKDPVVVLTNRRAETLKARAYDGDLARIVLETDRDVRWIHDLTDPSRDLSHPFLGPLRSERGGDAAMHRAALQLAKYARLLPAVVGAMMDDSPAVAGLGLTELPVEALASFIDAPPHLLKVVAARVPLKFSREAQVHVFRPDAGGEEHYAIEIGKPDHDNPVLARLHSACFTGDLLGSLKCDCGAQLHAALAAMGKEGAGVLLYLNQEGRGIGLANKLRAYSLQDRGFDTVEANHRLGFEDDERDFRIGAAILRAMGINSVRLMTNNPAKMRMMEANGVEVADRVPIQVGETDENREYLQTKAEKSGHLI